MPDEETTTTEATETEATEATPEITDEAVFAYLSAKVGHDVTAADLDRFKNLNEMAQEVMREKSELGRAKKAAATAAPAQTSDDDDVDLSTIDPATRKLLRKFIEQEFGSALSLPSVLMEDEVDEAISTFMESHADVPAEALGAVIAELEAAGAGPTKPTKRATTLFLKTAYDIAKSRTLDTDAIEKAAYEKALEKVAKESKEKGDVVAVEKKKGVSEKVDADEAGAELGFWERIGVQV